MNWVRGFTTLSLIALVGLASWPALVRADDLLEEARKRQEIEAQRVEAEVRTADKQALEVGKTDPAAAVQILRAMLAAVEANPDVPEARKAPLKRRLEIAIRAYAGRQADLTRPAPSLPDPRTIREDRDKQDAFAIQKALRDIESLRTAGRIGEAMQMQRDLAARYPDNPALRAGAAIGSASGALASARELRDDRASRWNGAIGSIEKSAVPETRDYKLPANWAELSKRRGQAMQLTETERAILTALNKPVSIDFAEGRNFDEVLRYLETAMGKPVVIIPPTPEDMNAAQVTPETPVKLRVDRVTMRTVLKKVLAELGMTYIIKDGTIQVMMRARAKDTMTTRAYYVGDLAAVVDLRYGPYLSQLQMIDNVNRIMGMIQQSVDPMSWEGAGGPGGGRMYFDPITMSIVVRQSAEVHMMLGTTFR